MPKFIVAVQVKSENGMHVGFLPGDAVPEWALKVVGDHVHDGKDSVVNDVEDSTDEDVQEDDSAESSESGVEDVQEEAPAVDVAPDFTKPAPAKRGRPRKVE